MLQRHTHVTSVPLQRHTVMSQVSHYSVRLSCHKCPTTASDCHVTSVPLQRQTVMSQVSRYSVRLSCHKCPTTASDCHVTSAPLQRHTVMSQVPHYSVTLSCHKCPTEAPATLSCKHVQYLLSLSFLKSSIVTCNSSASAEELRIQ